MVDGETSAVESGDAWSSVAGAERVAEAAAKLARLGNSAAEIRVRRQWLDLLAPGG
jgi:hypothetical protein